jgi:glutamine synthetase
VKEAARRGLPNLRRTPEALAQLTTRQSRTLLTRLGILTTEELESRYAVRLERYIKDMLIEAQTLLQIADTMVTPAALAYAGALAKAAAQAKAAGIAPLPQVDIASRVTRAVQQLQEQRAALGRVVEKAEHMHDDPAKAANLLTHDGADAMAAVRETCDALELMISDDAWPLPKYREMLFPV